MKTKTEISGHRIRSGAAAVFFLFALVALSSAFNSNRAPEPAVASGPAGKGLSTSNQIRTLTFADRVAYQRAIEDVYWRHRIWPKEKAQPKPSLDEVMSTDQIEKKINDYLRDSHALETYWQKPITSGQLQAEVERMARNTKQPEVLRELFGALGNDPFLIAECLARPVLTERLVADLSDRDRDQRFTLLRTQVSRLSITMSGTVTYVLPDISSSAMCTNNTWTATADTPTARQFHTAVWTGSEMIIWGGENSAGNALNTGGRYNPSTDSWTATSTTNAPGARYYHTAVWTGSEMIVWGGTFNYPGSDLNTGGRYNPSTDTWTATSITGTPSARVVHTAVWTGSEMVVWGGLFYDGTFHYLNAGGRYNPSMNTWTAISTTNAPDARIHHTAVWTGSEMIVWGGALDVSFGSLNTGGRYNPSTNTWTATSTTNAPDARAHHTAVWTGSEMIVWGGGDGTDTGGRYNPSTNTWTATSTTNAAHFRTSHTAVWTGSEMIVWGGFFGVASDVNTGGRYNPISNSWTTTSTTNAPAARRRPTAVWTGSQMIIWGGYSQFNGGPFPTGGRYCAAAPTPSANNLGNISTRLRVETGDNVLIGGFIVTGAQPKKVIVRAIGPSLTAVGVPGALGNPSLELHGSSGLIASNDNWMDAPNRQEIIDTGLAPANDFESAVLVTLPANNSNYTAIVRGVNNTTGVGLVEAYDLNTGADSKLANISTRGFVQSGDNVMIGGFIVVGQSSTRVIVRAIGPSLPLQDKLANPTLELRDSNGTLLQSNDNWRTGGQEADIIATGLQPSSDLEPAIVRTLNSGSYTAIVRGVNDTAGGALVEVYDLSPP